jgi:membrane fusion protein, multidrug efflux system
MNDDPSKSRRKRLACLYWGLCLTLLIAAALFWFYILRVQAYTSDAYVQGNQVFITPLVPGFIKAIHTDDTFFVKKGQLLVELDETDFRIQSRLNKKKLSQVVREVSQLFHQVFVYQEELEVRKAELIRSIQDYQHRKDVLDVEGVSLEDYEHAVATYSSSYHSFKMTHKLYQKALALVQGTTIPFL